MKRMKNIKFLILFTLSGLFAQASSGQKAEYVNFVGSGLQISDGNLVFNENATFKVLDKLVLNKKDTKKTYKIKIVLSGVEGNGKGFKTTLNFDYNPNSSSNGVEVSIKATPKNQIKIESVAHFIDDFQGETGYFKIDDKDKSDFAVLLNGISKPATSGNCKFGQCWCFAAVTGSSGKLIELDSAKITQTLSTDKTDKQTYLDVALQINNTVKSKAAPTLAQLVTWGEIAATMTAEIAGKPIKWRYEGGGITSEDEWQQPIYRVNVAGISVVKLENLVFYIEPIAGSHFGISSATLMLRDGVGYKKPTSNNFKWTEAWVVEQKYHLCAETELKASFMNYSEDTKNTTVQIGINKSAAGDLTILEKMLSTRKVTSYAVVTWQAGDEKPVSHTINAKQTKDGNWQYSDQIAKAKEGTRQFGMIELDMFFVTACKDTFKFSSLFKEKLSDKKDWDYKIKMSPVAIDNPIFQGAGNGSTNILSLTIPASNIVISGGNVVFKDNAQFSMLLSNTSNGTLDTSNISSASVAMTMEEGDGRVFYHWGSVVSTSNPKINTNFDTAKYGELTLQNIEIRMVNDNFDTLIYQFNLSKEIGKYGLSLDSRNYILILKKTDRIKYYNPCNTKYKLKEIEYSETSVSGIYSLQLSFQFEKNSDVPNATAMVVEIKDCSGNSQYVSITLKYNSSTGFYTGGVNLSILNKCSYTFHYAEIAAYNVCKDKTVWSIDATKAKGNGSGTKNASSQVSARPQLL